LHLHVDHLHMGLGGDDSWTPSVHPNFIIPPGNEWNWSFTLAPTQSDCDVRVLHNELHAVS
jgi:beta-galactosidase